MKVLIIDDDRELLELLSFALVRAKFSPIAVADPLQALSVLATERPEAIVLDVNLGGWSGLDLLREIRSRTDTPVVMLTGRGAEQDKIDALELGADDYVTKPFSHRELIARLRAVLRRRGEVDDSIVPTEMTAGPLTINLRQRSLMKNGTPVTLTVTEFRLLEHLFQHVGAVVSSAQLLRHVWGPGYDGDTDVVRVTMHRLRRKVEEDPARPMLLHTVTGVGIMLLPRTEQSAPQSTS